jgi:hypothetical protein
VDRIAGVHAIIFSKKPDSVRSFLKGVLGLRSVDAGSDWPIFALPPAEAAVHPAKKSWGSKPYAAKECGSKAI